MLKSQFTQFCQCYRDYLFSRWSRLHREAYYGVSTIKGFDPIREFLVSELLDRLEAANKRISPAANVFLPSFISIDQFTNIISDIKAKLP